MSFEQVYPHDKFANEVGAVICEFSDEHAVMELKVRENHLNAGKTAHGGVLFLLADITMAARANHNRDLTVSIQSDIRFLAAAFEGDTLRAEAVEVSAGRNLYNSRVTITNQDGKVVAVAEGMFYTKQRSQPAK